MLKALLKERDFLPVLTMCDGTPVTRENWPQRRLELMQLLEKYSYGHTPHCPVTVRSSVRSSDENSYAGKALDEVVDITFETEHSATSFPVEIFVPHAVHKPPVLVYLSFGKAPHKFIPLEEIIDSGYALAVIDYQDMVNDNHFGDFSDGIAAHFGTPAERDDEHWGKIGMWAYGASRVMDYLIAERDDVDTERAAIVGHSRLGKAALWCGAQDERFAAVISNNSGYGGAASSKHGTGERVTDFLRVGSWDWYCENFKKFRDELEDQKPYDQSFLLALVAPRLLCVGSAELDRGADPRSEFLTTLHASAVWELLGEPGLVTPDRLPEPGDRLFDGKVGYQLRPHRHFMSRADWAAYIEFLNKKFK